MPPTSEVKALITPASILPNVPIAGGHAEVKACLLPGCQPASSCSAPDTPNLPTRCQQRSCATCPRTYHDRGHQGTEGLPACSKVPVQGPPLAGAVPRFRPTYCSTPCLLPRYRPRAMWQGPAARLPYHDYCWERFGFFQNKPFVLV